MPEETQDQNQSTEATQGAEAGTEKKTETPASEGELTFAELTARYPQIQSEIDRRVTSAMAKAKEKAEKDAKERALIEQNNYKEAFEGKNAELTEALAKIESYERREKVEALLDKRKITNPKLRAVFHKMTGELGAVDEAIKAHLELITEVAGEEVDTRLDTGKTLPSHGKTEDGAPTTFAEAVKSPEAWKKYKEREAKRSQGATGGVVIHP